MSSRVIRMALTRDYNDKQWGGTVQYEARYLRQLGPDGPGGPLAKAVNPGRNPE